MNGTRLRGSNRILHGRQNKIRAGGGGEFTESEYMID